MAAVQRGLDEGLLQGQPAYGLLEIAYSLWALVYGMARSLITYGELYEGIYYDRDPQSNEQLFRQFLRWVDVVPLNRQIMRRFARIRGQLGL